MPSYEKKGDYLLVEVREPYSFDFFVSTMHEISARCQAENLEKVLVDLRETSIHPSIIERYEMGVEIARIWGPRIKAVAVANKNLINYLIENTAVNRGARFKVAADMENGLAWLHSE